METTTEMIETLNDLVAINNDRIKGYENALEEISATDTDLKTVFAGMITESHAIRMALGEEVQVMGGEIESGTTGVGKLYRAWQDMKLLFSGHNRHEVLSNCEANEDAIQKAYRDVLASAELPAFLRSMLKEQMQTLKASHDKIKMMRDQGN